MEIMLKNTSLNKKNMIYIIKQEGLYQNNVNSSLVSTYNCNMAYSTFEVYYFTKDNEKSHSPK